MAIKIIRRNYTVKNGVVINETNAEFEERVSELVDAQSFSIIAVLPEKEEGLIVDPVFIMKRKEQVEITAVVSVPIEQVDDKLAEGYLVHELYAKTATLVKHKVAEPKPEAEKDYVTAAIETAKISEATLTKAQ